MKTVLAALALAIALSGVAQADTSNNGNLPDWARKAFEQTH